MMMNLWRLYDALIEGIPDDRIVDEVVCGVYYALVRLGEGYGLSAVLSEDTQPVMMKTKKPGMKLRDLAGCVKSWNFTEASIGQAAINAYYNALPTALKNGVAIAASRFTEDRIYDPFITYQKAIRNKKVAVIKRFPYIEQLFQPVCDLAVFEKDPDTEEYPYTAAEYILPECDYVFITCNAFVDKSMPRLLELSKQATVIIVGPSTPLAPVLSEFGVSDLSGFVVKDGERAFAICSGQEDGRIYSAGQKVSLKFNCAGSPVMAAVNAESAEC
jgi:uncharacterized protein (DUF4213/DUF364 family)